MTRQELINLGDRLDWACPTCESTDNNANQQASQSTSGQANFRYGKTAPHRLKIVQLNIDSVQSKTPELRRFLKDHKPSLVLLQETKLIKKDRTPTFQHYTTIRRDRFQPVGKEKNRGGGLLILILKKIGYTTSTLKISADEDNTTEAQTIEIPTGDNGKLRITNIYIPPERPPDASSADRRERHITTDRWPTEEHDIILGDTNAHSVMWDNNLPSDRPDVRGGKIENWMTRTGMACLNTGEPTHHSKRRTPTSSGSAPDTAFVHPSLLDKISWEVPKDLGLGSDHMPIIMKFDTNIPTVNDKPVYRWDLAKADWREYTRETDKLPKIYPTDSLNKLEKKLRKHITKAANKHVRKKKITQDSKCWLTPTIKTAIAERNGLQKTIGTTRDQWTAACARVSNLVTEEKRKRWKEYVESLDRTTDSRKVWRTIRAMDGRNPPQNKNEALNVDGVDYVEDKDKAEQFAKTYRGFAKLPIRREDRRMRKDNRNWMGQQTALQACEVEFSMSEMERVIEETKNNKAAGEDEIPYELIKHLGRKAKELLLAIYNRCWAGEEIPSKWLTAIIKPLLKEGKDQKKTISYRPVSLTACLGKILEKMVADRLMHVLESRRLLNDNQAGFRQGRCTTDQVLKLVQEASDQMHAEGSNHRLIATFFDYEKAFDKVWRDGLLHKMIEQDIPRRFVKYVRHFLSNRTTQVEVNGIRSDTFTLKEGLPQGSSISPLLFLIFINDIDVELDPETFASLFADDTATWLKDGEKRGSHRRLAQREVDKIKAWANKWKMRLNASKTRSMITSTSSADRAWDPELKVDGKNIEAVQEYKFLGITVGNDLRFGKHIEIITAKCRKRVNIIKCLATKSWGNSLETQRSLYIQYVRSAMEYGSSSWRGWVADCQIDKLQRIQNEALRAVVGLASTCPVDLLHLESGIEPIKDRLDKNDEITWDRYLRLPTTDPRYCLTQKQFQTRKKPLKTRLGFRAKTSARFKFADVTRDTTTPPFEPWTRPSNLRFERVTLDRRKDEYSKEELNRLTTEKIDSMTSDIHIYTDGSTNGQQQNGGAGVYIEVRPLSPNGEWTVLHEGSYPAGKMCSSYTGECMALLKALQWIADGTPEPEYLICTDSRSLHDSLLSNSWKDPDPWLKKIKATLQQIPSTITLLWLPSHCGTHGNERADQLANDGTRLSQADVPVIHAIVKAKIRARPWKVTYPLAKQIYGTRRQPRFDIEGKWPRDVRSLYSRLRTGHCKELADYMYIIEEEPSDKCVKCDQGQPETIKHVLCECSDLDEERDRIFCAGVTLMHLTAEPESCRELLANRFPGLQWEEPRGEDTGEDEERVDPTAEQESHEDGADAGQERTNAATQWDKRSWDGSDAGRERVDPTTVQLEEPHEDGAGAGRERADTAMQSEERSGVDADAGREKAETATQLEVSREDEAGASRERADTPTQWEERSGHTENAGRERVDTAVQLEETQEDRTDAGQQRANGEDTQAGQGRADPTALDASADAARDQVGGEDRAAARQERPGGAEEDSGAAGRKRAVSAPHVGVVTSAWRRCKEWFGRRLKDEWCGGCRTNGRETCYIARPATSDSVDVSGREIRTIYNGKLLCDGIATAAMKLIEKLNPRIQTQPAALGSRPDLMRHNQGETVQVHHNGAEHWVTSSSMGGRLRLYDSLNTRPTTNLLEQFAAIYSPGSNSTAMARRTEQIHMAHRQRGARDCGLFAIAYAVDLAQGVEPSRIKYNQPLMRSHLLRCFASGTITQFPRHLASSEERPAGGVPDSAPAAAPPIELVPARAPAEPPDAPDPCGQ
jgi:ribonuclease HI/exonuclease III